MTQTPHPDSSAFADLMDFMATSGRTRSQGFVAENADALVAGMWAGRAQAMTQSLVTLAKAALPRGNA